MEFFHRHNLQPHNLPRYSRLRGGAALSLILTAIGVIALLGFKRQGSAYSTTAVVRQNIETKITAVGTLQPRRYVDVGAQVSGQITQLHVEPGDEVTKGQLLVEINPSVQQPTVDVSRAQMSGLRARMADQQAQHRLASQQLVR